MTAVSGTLDLVREHGVIAVVTSPREDRILEWGRAVAKGGVRILTVPGSLSRVTELTADLVDEAGLHVGVSGVVTAEQVSSAVAAGAEFILSPVSDREVVAAARTHGLTVITGAATPSELLRASTLMPDLLALFPAAALGGASFFRDFAPQLFSAPICAWGGVDVETAPSYLEAGAVAAIVDRGIFPSNDDPAAAEVIEMRARALVEVCADALAMPVRISMIDQL